MAYLTIEDATVTGAQAVFNLKELMKSAGYTVMSSSDGTTYNASGDQITTGSSGAGGMNNSRAWFRIRSPDGINEWVFQRGTSSARDWRLITNFNGASFTTGSPAATVTPDSTNGVTCLGGGTSASPTFNTNAFPVDSSYRWKALVDNAAPYGWWAAGVLVAGSTPATGFVWDPISAAHPSDTCNFVFYGSGFADTAIGTFNLEYGTNDGNVVGGREYIITRIPGATLSSAIQTGIVKYVSWGGTALLNWNTSTTTGLAQHPITSKDIAMPLMYARTNAVASSNFKGISSFIRLKTQNRTTGTVLEYGTGNYAVVMRDVILPWDKSTFTL